MNLSIEPHLLTPNPYSRPQLPLRAVQKLIVHWVANPMTSALANRNYFENLKLGLRGVYASSHYIIGLQGEILQCVPDTEVAYHAKNANTNSLGIELCHPDWEGAFAPPTYEALVALLTRLCHLYTLDPLHAILRHYDVTGKVCPKYYVSHPAHWTKLKEDVVALYTKTYLQLPTALEPALPLGQATLVTPSSIELKLGDTLQRVQAVKIHNHYFVRLRDLEGQMLTIDYDSLHHYPLIQLK